MKLYLVRHGETFGNKYGIVQGDFDMDMTEEGYFQAEKLGERFKDKHFDKIYTSNLRRAKNTAQAITQHTGQEIEEDIVLKERSMGKETGKDRKRISNEEMHQYNTDEDHKFEDGESVNELKIRLQDFIQKIKEHHNEGEEILVVSHQGTIRAILANIFNMGMNEVRDKFKTSNTSVMIVDVTDWNNPKIELENCTEHLN